MMYKMHDMTLPVMFRSKDRLNMRHLITSLCHWAVWTKRAVELFEEIKQCVSNDYAGAENLLAKGIEVTDMNAAIFNAKNTLKDAYPVFMKC